MEAQKSIKDFSKPADIDTLTVVFPIRVLELMPAYVDIPKEFKTWPPHNRFGKFFSDMFYQGVTIKKLTPKDGIDAKKAMRHLRTIAGSFEPKHEHKEAAFAYLMSLWFDDIEWTVSK